MYTVRQLLSCSSRHIPSILCTLWPDTEYIIIAFSSTASSTIYMSLQRSWSRQIVHLLDDALVDIEM